MEVYSWRGNSRHWSAATCQSTGCKRINILANLLFCSTNTLFDYGAFIWV